jgi:hypothetical protein
MIKTLHFLGTLTSFNCYGTLASQQLTNTLFNMGLKTWGVTNSVYSLTVESQENTA